MRHVLKHLRSLLGALVYPALLCGAALADAGEARAAPVNRPEAPPMPASGIQFACAAEQLAPLERDMKRYLAELNIAPELYRVAVERAAGKLRFTLNTAPDDTSTLDFTARPELAIPAHIDWLPTASGGPRNVLTVSDKEIALALMQHGRLTEFSGGACDIDALREHIGIRHNIVAWAERLEWGWPAGRPSKWNRHYWRGGTPKPRHPLAQAVNDAFFHQEQYAIGCYAAARLVVVQGILDYYHRIRKDPAKARLVEARLLADHQPLADLEPGGMWHFEADFDPRQQARPGKILRITHGVAPKNFVPGDWPHFLNTDPVTYDKPGYEGSNPIYLGRNRFGDYYSDHNHAYSLEEKLNEVYQWRNRVFNARRDKDKIARLAPEDYERLGRSPEEGGLLLPLRTTPYLFGFEGLPDIGR